MDIDQIAFAKVGTVGLPDFVNVGLVDNESLGGYMEANPGTSTYSTWWSTARRRKTFRKVSRSSTTSTISAPSCSKTPRPRERVHRATNNGG